MALNWSGAGMGALGGAASGATLGSLVPGIGTIAGSIGGGLLGGVSGLMGGGEEPGVKTAPTINPEQQKYMSMLLGQGGNMLQNPFAGFAPIAQQAMNQFQQQIVPSLAERFTSMGGGRLSSPAFASQLGQAGSGLEQALAAMQSQYGQQNQHNAMSMLALGLSPSFENFYSQGDPGVGRTMLGGIGSGLMQAAPSFYQSYMLNQALQKMQNQVPASQVVGPYSAYSA